MPTASAGTAPSKAKVSTKTITTQVTEPVEQNIPAAAAPIEPREDFWKYIESLSADDWKTHHVTLYRYPLGQTKPQRLGRYVKTYKAENPLTSEDQIFDEFGGSQYDALLKGPGKNGERWQLLAKHSWEMDGPAKNPWATSSTTAVAPGPSELANTLQVVLQNLKTAERSPNAAESPAIKESISLIQQLTSAMPKPQGVGELVSALADLKKITGAGDGGGNSIVETIKVLKELGLIGAERKSLAGEIKEILEITAMMGGGGGTGKRDFATALIDAAPTIIEKVTPIADRFAETARANARIAELRAGVRPSEVSAPPTRQAPALVPPQASPAAAAPAAESPASARVVAPPETEAPAKPATAVYQAPNLEWVKARAVQLFALGKDGDAIAEWLDSIDEQLGNFLGGMDQEKFAAFVRGDAILSQIATAPRFPEFVEQFVAYFSEEPAAETP